MDRKTRRNNTIKLNKRYGVSN